ncbi:hypothetical protein RSAG8_01920, partial [Rhizoctonia solani AG-8 WAC10335]
MTLTGRHHAWGRWAEARRVGRSERWGSVGGHGEMLGRGPVEHLLQGQDQMSVVR